MFTHKDHKVEAALCQHTQECFMLLHVGGQAFQLISGWRGAFLLLSLPPASPSPPERHVNLQCLQTQFDLFCPGVISWDKKDFLGRGHKASLLCTVRMHRGAAVRVKRQRSTDLIPPSRGQECWALQSAQRHPSSPETTAMFWRHKSGHKEKDGVTEEGRR